MTADSETGASRCGQARPPAEATNATFLDLVTFHLTGETAGGRLEDIAGLGLCPAHFAGYRNLTGLRYDYPLVLVGNDPEGLSVRSLSAIIDGVLQEIAPQGIEGERLRRHALRIEHEIRTQVSQGAEGSLSGLWAEARKDLLAKGDEAEKELLKASLDYARGVLPCDGQVVDCNETLPVALLSHVWNAAQTEKSRRFREKIGTLVLKLSDVLRSDFMKSDAARAPDSLKQSVGGTYEAAFDFEAMSGILPGHSPGDALPEARRRRIESAISVLEAQRFFASAHPCKAGEKRDKPHSFVFDSCAGAMQSFDERLPEIAALLDAISIAELEVENRYEAAKHDSFFGRSAGNSLSPADLALFPSYLVCLRHGQDDPAEKARLIEALSSGLPLKIVVQTGDILGEPSAAGENFVLGARSSQLATMAVGLNSAFVLQSGSSHLYQLRDRILSGLTYHGPALFSIFSGSAGSAGDIPVYLETAAAVQSRAFPCFTYDPSAGADWASRFRIDDNPQPDRDWPARRLAYEDEELQTAAEDIAFTFVDFAACDSRYAGHFVAVPRAGEYDGQHDGIVPAQTYLEPATAGASDPEKAPYIWMVDANNVLRKVIVSARLLEAARRCAGVWRSLQELGGINNSHAARLLAREREAWEQDKEREIEALKGRSEPAAASMAAVQPAALAGDAAVAEAAVAEAPVPEAEEAPSDDPYIETPRCTTCNECTELNGKMFAYDENKQAYIADPDAGTFRQMVEAAESCQVAIIHPGKPRNPDEPNLDELTERAEAFN